MSDANDLPDFTLLRSWNDLRRLTFEARAASPSATRHGRRVMQWRPIETAPRDEGVVFLACSHVAGVEEITPITYALLEWHRGRWVTDGEEFVHLSSFTHWAPIEPPQEGE